jgi:uncharacterized SAM-binding protein YcdF (DUF218 family)
MVAAMRGAASRMMGWTRLFQAVGLVGILSLVAVTLTPLPNALFRWSATPSDIQAADAVVVLAAAVDADGTLSSDSLARAVRGIALYREGRAPLLVFSGTSGDEGPSEAHVRTQLARALGVPSEALLTETSALTTREEAARIGAVLRARNVRRILLVTDSQHMRRASPLFERIGLQVFPATADARSGAATSPGARLRIIRDLLGEWLALGYYRVAGYL